MQWETADEREQKQLAAQKEGDGQWSYRPIRGIQRKYLCTLEFHLYKIHHSCRSTGERDRDDETGGERDAEAKQLTFAAAK